MNNDNTDFTRAMYLLYHRTDRETGYKATGFRALLDQQGGEATAIQLIHASKPSEGYTKLCMMNPPRLDLTVAAAVVENGRWRTLFPPETVELAERRLIQYGYRSRSSP
ncbi:MAG: hypothetical protein KGQ79_05900 [Proteobacteria bacterium]|nr:hypothetical protein [Pseudomonadota bacterium]